MSNLSTLNAPFPEAGDVGLQRAIDDKTGVLGTMGGFLTGKVGRKIVISYTDTTKATISSVSYYDGATLLYTLAVTAPSSTSDAFERTV